MGARFSLIPERLKYKKFRKTEDAIFEAVADTEDRGEDLFPGRLSKKAGVSRVTLYRHHYTVGRIRKDYQKALLRKYRNALRDSRESLSLEQCLYRMLFFIMQNKRLCRYLMKDWDESLVQNMLMFFAEKMKIEYRLGERSKMVFSMYVGEVYALIMMWGRHNFSEIELESVHRYLMFLTRTAVNRLETVECRRIGDGKW